MTMVGLGLAPLQAMAQELPGCLGPNALKFQPSSTVVGGWNIGVGGLFALPFRAAAIVRGKCN
jgi:hypothetical protein